jgi:predicted Rossmann-fold nucleotide-binding protein
VRHFPVILVGSRYWSGLLDWVRQTLIPDGTVGAADLALLQVTDDADEVVRLIRSYVDGSTSADG